MLTNSIYCPGIDSQSANPVVPVDPEEVLLNGFQMPLLVGHTNREGLAILIGKFKKI